MDVRFALLLACFFLSGFAALLYQTAWTRELSFVFGTSELAVAAVLAAYLGGLALGAAAAARFASRLRRPVLVYGVLELAIALCAVSVPAAIRGLNALYVGLLGGGPELAPAGATGTAAFQLGAAFAVLLPPTALMGATLPLLARHAVRTEAEIGSRVGALYAVNTAGAIAGTLCAAFWLMPEIGLRRTVWSGAGVNAAVFALAALLARTAPVLPSVAGTRAVVSAGPVFWILPAVLVSGAVSFAYEVLWTRLLGHLLGASVQAFATMLASFLLGITLGSALAARLASSRERSALGFGVAQLGIAAASYAALALADRLPELADRLGAGPDAPLASAAVAAAVLLPITLCLGATFPFAVRLLARRPEEAAGATARVYAWNTIGAIAGALGAGFVLLPAVGFEGTLAIGVGANLLLAALAGLAVRPRRLPLAVVAAGLGVLLVLVPPRPPWALLTSSPLQQAATGTPGEILYSAVGRSSSVMLFDQAAFFRLTTNGLPEARVDREGFLLQTMIAHWMGMLPVLIRPDARDMLVVGLGGGMALEGIPGTIERIDVIELEPEVLEANRAMSAVRARDPLTDPRVHVHIGDARGALQLTARRYDAIVSQPSHPWTSGASHLYTREFFSLVRSRLEPGGVFIQWIGLRFADEALLRSLVATLVETFGHVDLYQPVERGMLFAASDQPLTVLETASRALRAAPADFARFGIHRVEDVASVWALDASGARVLAEGAPANTDDHNRLASRAARLGDAALARGSTRPLLRPIDPLREMPDAIDAAALARALTARGLDERAAELAGAPGTDPAVEEALLGWIEVGKRRWRRSARHFERALALDPSDAGSRAGLVASYRDVSARGIEVPELSEAELDPRHAALIASWRHAEAGRWEAVAPLDATLAAIAPGEPLFEQAAGLRARWRVESGDPGARAEALAILETRLVRQFDIWDALLYADAAIQAGRPKAAWGALRRLADRRPTGPRAEVLLARARKLVEKLPEDLRARLQ